ncbi:protein slit-like isoform X1 [Bombus vosnesenskii]|uniref:Protein slit-like isoform X1 n=2 Tax=Bombus vosnesenskii TaxID=207650 RepID=A0A6J3LGY7_9HYME|nr:protein slit-like isoform X1 [Bombus vosnesenskii]XP_033364821.1 protein slit-like isoform X1 [Bombus vosnesenskii]XP_033364822.1 protein slit-like isoform X1 [Bombus vosnesenskii]XP_033364823.1 protein slit-like isoform X1 [Bombus vosnesenskii]XP_033364824.1 protein slit-like isoform X1 [Bombus vosnesenskii]
MHLILLWALAALIGQVECKCSLARIVNDERSIAYVCTHGDLDDLDEISSDADWIEFTVSRFSLITDNAFWRFKNLQRLSFYNCHINFISPGAFTGLDRLEWLIFHGTKMHVARTAWFRPLTNLRRLILDRCDLVHIEPDLFRMLPRLEVLGLRDNDLNCLPIDELPYLRMLRTVRIDGNPWLCECRRKLDEYFRSRSIVQEVECLKQINDCRKYQCMTPIGFTVLPSTLTTQQLHDFNRDRTIIRGNEFQTNVFTSLDRLPDKTTWIEISGLKIDTLPRYAFFRFGNSLRTLDLVDCGITTIEDGAFAGLHKLQRLSLVGNRLPVLRVNWFRDLVSLQQLILERNGIEKIERTALWHVGDSLRHLDIQDNLLRCITTEELAELTKLERLDAMKNPWLCTCRTNLQNFLTQRNVGFEINAGRCYQSENEIPDGRTGWHEQQTIQNTSFTTGKVQWTSFENSLNQTNISVIGTPPPPFVTPSPPEVHIVSSSPSIYTGACNPEKTSSNTVYTCRAITSIEELNLIPSTAREIRIILSNIKKIPENTFARFNGYLSKLELRDCGIESIKPRAFSNLRNLEHLSLRSNQLESINWDMVQGLHNLKHLDVSHNNIYRITNDVFDHLPYLISLDVSDNAMNCIGIEYIAHQLRYLSSLDVSNNPWSCLCGTKLAEFLDSRGIQYNRSSLLLKEDCYASPVPEVTHSPSISMTISPTARNETIEGTCIIMEDTTRIRYRCTGGNLLLLQSIRQDATSIEFYEGHLPRLPAESLRRFVNLQELVIRNSELTTVEEGAFNGLNKLENLTIQDNPLEMVGSSWFAFPNLGRLDLRGNSIKYIESGSFRYLKNLTYLNLEGNDLRCIFTSDLNDMPNVYIVEFSGNPLKWRCRVELEQFLEARKIRFIKIENSCEGKTLVRNLLLVNKTDGSFDCPSECSKASISRNLFVLFILPSLITLAH